MAESRDRLVRTVDLAEVFARRHVGPSGILSDEAVEILGVTRRPTGVAGATVLTARGGGFRRGNSFGTPRFSVRRGRNRRENTPATPSPLGRGRGGGSGTMLPSWYPRTPLHDITAVARAIERRRAGLGDGEGLLLETPVPSNETILGSNISSVAQLERNFSTPASTSRSKPRPPTIKSMSKILLNVTNKKGEESEEGLLTPQKKLLNSIETVEKAVMEECRKMKRTPSARKAERQHKVRTLMSMR
ncbi:ras-related protein RABA4d-like [Hibiscus syriacus]|uniref:Ras-related protein RABA4d-like n=1 Tax=Hibiscus syriacus TaxID=106335 RepID=A0A6A2XP91_HIBSY|nr:protein POLYCHOME-like [Hibiscus syriacus]KAE8671690.1 ras-related protein RABA4d-like [Hibiscus syriacus]